MVTVKELTKIYGRQKAVDSLGFEAQSGRILGFLGPNGAGKSTTMRMLTGYLRATSGSILIDGEPMNPEAVTIRKKVGYLPENTPLYADMYVREFLHFAAAASGVKNPAQRVDEVIKQVGLEPEKHKKISMLSKGYKQRVGMAQAIIHEPALLILDEPTSGLDPNQLTEIRSLIKSLGENRTVIISTHIMQEVEALCDDVVIINQGRLVANSSLLSLKEKYASLSLEEIFKLLTAPHHAD